MKKVIILGSTGSIGKNAIKVIQALKGFKIVGIAGYKNYQLLLKQAKALYFIKKSLNPNKDFLWRG